MIIAIIVSILSGVTIVLSRTTNALLSMKTNTLISTFYNYLVGLFFSIIILLVFKDSELGFSQINKIPSYIYLLGGPIGILAVFFSSYLALKIPSLVMTLLLFFGQIVSAIIIDCFLTNTLDTGNIIGGMLVFIGLLFINQK